MNRSTDENITFKGTLTFKDFKKYNMFHVRKAMLSMFILSFLLSFLLLSAFIYEDITLTVLINSFIIGVFGLLFLFSLNHFQTRKLFYSESFLKLQQVYTVNKEGMILETERSKTYYRWSDVTKSYELEEMFLLYVSKAKAMVIPKTYFFTESDIDTFRSFIKIELNDHKTLMRNEKINKNLTEKILAAIPHVIAIIPIPGLNFTITFVYWYFLRYQSKFIDFHGKQSINFQLSLTIYSLTSITVFYTVNFLLRDSGPGSVLVTILAIACLIAGGLFYVVTIIIALIGSLLGKEFKYPLTIRILR
ncbi:DUF4870 domain-containing protein [Bacillus sp. AK128]